MAEIIKHAKLFEVGSYEDKGLDVDEEDLDAIIQGTTEVPLTVGHLDPSSENPLHLGTVGNLYRKGRELFGVIRFVPEAWSLALRSGARRLSICLDWLRRKLVEVSLVTTPRVADARVKFGDQHLSFATEFDMSLDDKTSSVRAAIYDEYGPMVWVSEVYERTAIVERCAEILQVEYSFGQDGEVRLGVATPVERTYSPIVPAHENPSARFDARVVEALARERDAVRTLSQERAQATVERWKREGRLVPAAAEDALRMLADGGSSAEAFRQFMDAQPASLLLRETVPIGAQTTEPMPELDADEVAFCERAGIEPEEYRWMKARPGFRARRGG